MLRGLLAVAVLGGLGLATADAAAKKKDSPYADIEKSYAENNWPVGFKLPPEVTEPWAVSDKDKRRRESALRKPKADILVWTPPKAKKVRAVFLIPNNTDSKHIGEHSEVRKVAEKHEIGIIYLRNFGGKVIEWSDPPKMAEKGFADVLAQAAKWTGIEEYKHAPWIIMGKSSRGRFAFRPTWWFPKRVVASFSYHGETPTWPMPEWSKVKKDGQSVLHLAINGQEEWSGTWYRHVRPCMLNYHANTDWLTHQVVLHGVGHGNYVDMHGSKGWGKPVPKDKISCLQVWDYIALYMDKAMELRVPKDTYATKDKPVKLKQVDRSKGFLIHPRAPEELLGMKWMAFRYNDGKYQIIPWPDEKHPVHDKEQGTIELDKLIRHATDVPEDQREKLFWIGDRQLLEAWFKLHNVNDLQGVLPEKKDK